MKSTSKCKSLAELCLCVPAFARGTSTFHWFETTMNKLAAWESSYLCNIQQLLLSLRRSYFCDRAERTRLCICHCRPSRPLNQLDPMLSGLPEQGLNPRSHTLTRFQTGPSTHLISVFHICAQSLEVFLHAGEGGKSHGYKYNHGLRSWMTPFVFLFMSFFTFCFFSFQLPFSFYLSALVTP